MQIEAIKVYRMDLPLREGRYAWSEGKFVEVFDSTIVEILCTDGLSGWGEVCPLGPVYLPAYAAGARQGIRELAPQLLGADPTQPGLINALMDQALKGHPYVKSALDMACWDLLGRTTGLPCWNLMGGRFGEAVQLYRAISQAEPERMAENVASYRAEGYRRFQLKVGGEPGEDIARIKLVREVLAPDEVLVADANTGWTRDQALRVIRAVQDLDVYIEQPCLGYADNLAVRRLCPRPFVLDETVDAMPILAQAHADLAMDVVNLKISKFGGLTRTLQARDFCVAMGTPMTIEDSWGGDIVTAAIAQLAHSTPERYRFSATDFNSYNTVGVARNAIQRQQGCLRAPDLPGLGVEPDRAVLGQPLFVLH